MPGQQGKTSVWVALLSGPKVTTGGRDVTVSKFSLDVLESWNEKDIRSVLSTASGVPRGVSVEILKSDDGGKTVVPFKTSRGKPLDGKLIAADKIKTLYLRPSKAMAQAPSSPVSERKEKGKASDASSKKTATESPAKAPGKLENPGKGPEEKRGRGRPSKSTGPQKKGPNESTTESRNETKAKPSRSESKAAENGSSKSESRSARSGSKTDNKREISKSPAPRTPEASSTRRGRSPIRKQVVTKGKGAAANGANESNGPNKPVKNADSLAPSKSPGRSGRNVGKGAATPEKPTKTLARGAASPAAIPASSSRSRGRPPKEAATPKSPTKPEVSPEKPVKGTRGQTQSPAPSKASEKSLKSPAVPTKSPGRPTSRSVEKQPESPEKPARGRGRPSSNAKEPAKGSENPSKTPEKPKAEQGGSVNRGRGRPLKSPLPAKAEKSPATTKTSSDKPAESLRNESRGRGRPASTTKVVKKEVVDSPRKSGREQSAGEGGKQEDGSAKTKKAASSPAPSPARGAGSPRKAEKSPAPSAKTEKEVEKGSEKRGRGRPPLKKTESDDKADDAASSSEPRKRGRPKKEESGMKSPSRSGRSSESVSPVKTPRKDKSPKKEKPKDVETPVTEKRQRRAPKKFEDYDSDYQIDSKKSQEERKSGKEPPKVQDKKEVADKKVAAKKVQEKEKVEKGKEKETQKQPEKEQEEVPLVPVAEASEVPAASPRKRKASTSAGEESPEKVSPKAKKSSLGMLKVKMAFKGKEKESEIQSKIRAASLSPTPKASPKGRNISDRPKSLSPPRGKMVLMPAKDGNTDSPIRKVYVPSISDLMTGRKDIEPRNRPVTCLDCGEIVANRDQLYHHKAQCASIGLHKVYACQDCPSSYYSRSDLLGHRRREHFKSPGAHMIEKYGSKEGERPESYDMGNWDVSGHTVKACVSGTNGKDYNICICMACRAVFVSNEMLEAHMKEMHPEFVTNEAEAGVADGANESPDKDKGNAKKDDAEKEVEAAKDTDTEDEQEAGPSLRRKDSPTKKASESPSKRPLRETAKKVETPSKETGKVSEEPKKAAKTAEKKKQSTKEPQTPPKKSMREEETPAEPQSPLDDSSSRRSGRKRKPSQWMKDYVESEDEVKKPKQEEERRGRPRKVLAMTREESPTKVAGRRQVVKVKMIQTAPKKRREDEEELGFLCEECDAGCRSAKELEMHIMDVHRIQCQCGKKFMYRADLECHKIVSCSAATWHCFECGNNFESRQTYNDHRDACASGQFKCATCGALSMNAKEHRKHRSSCNPRVKCKICNLYFINKEVLLTHMEKRHLVDGDESSKVAEKDSTSEPGAVLGTLTVVPQSTEEDEEEEEDTSKRRSTRSRGSSAGKSPEKAETSRKVVSDKEKQSPSKSGAAGKSSMRTAPSKTPPAKEVEAPKTKQTADSSNIAQAEKAKPKAAIPPEKTVRFAPATPASSSSSTATPSTSNPSAGEERAANKSVSFIVSSSQLNELMSGGQEKLMKFLKQQKLVNRQAASTPEASPPKASTPARKPSPVKQAVKAPAKAAPATVVKSQTPVKVPAKTPGKATPVMKQEKSEEAGGKMSFVVTASQLQDLMKSGQDGLKSFLSTQIKKSNPVKVQPATVATTPQRQPVTTTVTTKLAPKVSPKVSPVVTPKPVTLTKPISPVKKISLAPENDPRLRRAIPLSPPKGKATSPPAKQVVESPTSAEVEETVNIPVGNSCINIPMSIIQSHIAEGHPEGTTKQLLVTTSEGVPYSVFVNANEDGSNIQIRLEKIEDEDSLMALQGLQDSPSPPQVASPPRPSKTIQVVTVSQPETQEVTVMPPHLGTTGSPPQPPSILRKRRLSDELVETAAAASMPKVPKLGNLGQYKIHCKDCQMLFDSYALFTRHSCVQKAQEKRMSPAQAAAAATRPTATHILAAKSLQSKKRTYYECSCCHQVFSSMLLFNRHVCSTDSQDGTEWKVQSLGSGGTKPGASDVEWLIAEAGNA